MKIFESKCPLFHRHSVVQLLLSVSIERANMGALMPSGPSFLNCFGVAGLLTAQSQMGQNSFNARTKPGRALPGAAALSSRHRHQAVFRPNRFRLPSTTTTTRNAKTLQTHAVSTPILLDTVEQKPAVLARRDPIRHRARSPDFPLVNPHPDPRPPPHPRSQSVSSIIIIPDIRDVEPSSRRPIIPPDSRRHNSSSDLHANALA